MSLAKIAGVGALVLAPLSILDVKYGERAYGFSVIKSLFNPCASTNYTTIGMSSSPSDFRTAAHCNDRAPEFDGASQPMSAQIMRKEF